MFQSALICLIAWGSSALAQPPATAADATSLASLIELGLEHSLDHAAARVQKTSQVKNATVIDRGRLIPQVTASAGYQYFMYDQKIRDAAGNLVSNNSDKPTFGLTVSYDLQKLFAGDSKVAAQAVVNAGLFERITKRDVVRNIKKAYYTIVEIRSEIAELNKLIGLFSKIEEILEKQMKLGIYNEVERKLFSQQQSILRSDLQTRSADLETTFFQLSLYMNVDADLVRAKVAQIASTPPLRFATRPDLSPEVVSKLDDAEVIANLQSPYNLAKMDYEKYVRAPIPAVYAKFSREQPNMQTSDGHQNIAEAGISFPIDGIFNRSAQKAHLAAQSTVAATQFARAMLDYRNQIRLNVVRLKLFKGQEHTLDVTRAESRTLLDKAFLFYSQKRVDVMGTLGIFQQYLQAARNDLINDLNIELIDSDLEYLVGGGAP